MLVYDNRGRVDNCRVDLFASLRRIDVQPHIWSLQRIYGRNQVSKRVEVKWSNTAGVDDADFGSIFCGRL